MSYGQLDCGLSIAFAKRAESDAPRLSGRASERSLAMTSATGERDGGISARRVLLLLFSVCLVCISIGIFAVDRPETQRPVSLPDMSSAEIVEIRSFSGDAVLTGELRPHTDSLGHVEKDAALIDRRGNEVIGEVEIEIPGPDAPNPRQELEIDIIKLAPSAAFELFIDNRPVTTFVTDDRGSIDLEIEAAPATPPVH
jgi:hypothetical protein